MTSTVYKRKNVFRRVAPAPSVAGPPPNPLGVSLGDTFMVDVHRHVSVRPSLGTTASGRYETEKRRLGGREPPSQVVPCRHFKRKHKFRDMVTSTGFVCACRTGSVNAVVHQNPYSTLYDPSLDHTAARKDKDGCTAGNRLKRKAKRIVKLLAVDQGLKASRKLPPNIVCGSLRASVRSIYPPELTTVQELSIKTSAKAESQPCAYCEVLQKERIDKWKKARQSHCEVDENALLEFSRAFAANVPTGWNTRRTPYIPNGHGSLDKTRGEGGNWVPGQYSDDCRVELVWSSGKPRVVTLYSSYNVAVLTPLHHSLYSHLRGKGWLLVGDPTDEKLRHLSEGCEGPVWHSFDYESATDNIKTAYVRRAVEILIDKGEGLSEDETRCLMSLSSMSLDGVSCGSGQPMGSPMSFPLLCLINKTVVDLALTDLLIEGEIGFKEWTRHRCLINGDDLLTKSTSSGDLVARVSMRGNQVGLVTNAEKTMSSPEYGEINSTVFKNCVRQKKTNVASLWMSSDVPDVLGFADESCRTPRGFRMVSENAASRLARQKIKTSRKLPYARVCVALSSRKLKTALRSQPTSEVPKATNLFPVVPVPDGYDLSREEQDEAIRLRVERIREWELYKPIHAERRRLTRLRKNVLSEPVTKRGFRYRKVLRPTRPSSEEYTLLIFAERWKEKRMEDLRASSVGDTLCIVSDLGRFAAIRDEIRAFKEQRKEAKSGIPSAPDSSGGPDWQLSGYVAIRDE